MTSFTRRQLLGAGAALGMGRALSYAQPQAAAGIHYREYARCLPDYLAGMAGQAYARRNARIAALKTPAAVREYQAWARATWLNIVGPLPERSALNVRTAGAFDRERYRVEKLVYESRPGFFVTANLYLPKQGSGPYPGVLFQMGHSADGKGSALYQRCCQGLVQLGYVVLAFDPIGQGERTNYPRPGGWLTRLQSVDHEHTVPGQQVLLTGETMSGMQLWDAMRSLDVLASHPQVNARQLGSTGQSGGATLTMLLAGADERLAAAAVSSGNTENFAITPFLSPGSADDAEQDFIGSGRLAFDRWDLLWPMAPRPLLVAISARDFFGTYSPMYEKSGREEFANLSRAYTALGGAGKLTWFETPLPHGLSYSLRVAIYNCFERGLKNSERHIDEEPPTAPEAEETLWCGATGNHVRDFSGKTPLTLARERAASIRTPEKPPDLRELLGIEAAAGPPRLEVRGQTRYADCEIHAVEVNTVKQVWAPAWLFLPKKPWSRMLLMVEPNGRNGPWREDDLYPQLAAAGVAVCAQDVRGVGDLEAQFSPGSAGYERGRHNENSYSWACLILGRTLLGQRTQDIAAMAGALAAAYPRATLVLAARDKMTVPALCAAALETKIAKTYLSGHLVSWRALLALEDYSHTFANFVPNVLAATDLPQIAKSVAPRPVVVAGAVDGAGNPVSRAEADYADYRAQPAWDFAALSGL